MMDLLYSNALTSSDQKHIDWNIVSDHDMGGPPKLESNGARRNESISLEEPRISEISDAYSLTIYLKKVGGSSVSEMSCVLYFW